MTFITLKMKRKATKYTILIFFILISGFISNVSAQTYDEARKLAFDGQRAKARQLCKAILASGFNSDVALLLGRTYAWDGQYDSSRVVLTEVLKQKPGNTEALDALADVEYWSANYSKAIDYCDEALQKDSTDENFLLKKARIQHSSKNYDGAVETLKKLLQINPSNAEALKKLQEFRPDALKNAIKLNYVLEYFDGAFNRDPWQMGIVSLSRKTKFGSVIGRVNLASRFGTTAAQYEVDAWPRISENNYGYLNYGFSRNTIFPHDRLGFEWYHNFPKAFEGSAGMRMLFFSSSSVDIYTATIGKYLGNYWISLRSFVTPGGTGTSVSGLLQIRRYFSDPENYLGFRVGYGVSPDDNRNLINTAQRLTLKNQSVRFEFNHLMKQVWIFNGGVLWNNEEIRSGKFAGYYTLDLSISRLF